MSRDRFIHFSDSKLEGYLADDGETVRELLHDMLHCRSCGAELVLQYEIHDMGVYECECENEKCNSDSGRAPLRTID